MSVSRSAVPTRHASTKVAVTTVLLSGAVITCIVGIANEVSPELPRVVTIPGAILAGVCGVVAAYVSASEARNQRRPVEQVSVPGAVLTSPRPRVSAAWLGATAVFAVLTPTAPPLGLLMILTSLMAFRLHRAALGVALAIVVVVAAGLAIILLAMASSDPSASSYDLCLAQGYPPRMCR